MKALKLLKLLEERMECNTYKFVVPHSDLQGAIAELEAISSLQSTRSCDGCKFGNYKKESIYYSSYVEPCRSCNRFAIDRYEAKDKQ